MLLKSTKTFLTIFFIGLFVGTFINSGYAQDNKAALAFQYFDEQNYAAAEPLFKSLIEEKPELLMLYYYYGVSRTENRKYSEYDLIQLLNANPNEVPANINYYLGVQYHALNNWEQAIRYYNNFILNSTPEEQAKLNLAGKIQQCNNKINPFISSVNSKETISVTIPVELNSSSNDDLVFNTNPISSETDIDNPVFETEVPVEIQYKPEPVSRIKTIEFRVNSQITYYSPEQFKTEEGKSAFEKAQEKQQELNAALNKLETLRSQYQSARGSEERNRIGQEIIPLESEIYSKKEEVALFFIQAENIENNYWKNASEQDIEDFLDELESYTSVYNVSQQQTTTNNCVEFIDPSLLFQKRTETVKEERKKSDELIYKIQIGAYSRALPAHIDRLFKKLSVLRRIENYTDEKGVVVYTTGNLTNFEDAEKMRLQVKQEGAEDAIVVPYFNGKRITLEEAKKIENNL